MARSVDDVCTDGLRVRSFIIEVNDSVREERTYYSATDIFRNVEIHKERDRRVHVVLETYTRSIGDVYT